MTDRVRTEEGPVSRRRFLAGSLWSVVGVMAGALVVLGAVPVVASALRRSSRGWSPIGKVDAPQPGGPDLTVEGKPVLTSFTTVAADAYLPPEQQRTPIFVVNEGGGRFEVFDAGCTHLGCPLTWDGTSKRFVCPCHGGAFDLQGKVVAGPPPRPLDRYEWKVQDGVLYAGPPLEAGSG